MKHVTASLTVDAPIDVVWPLLAEFRYWPEWGPSIRAVEADVDAVAPGVTGRVQTVVGVWLPFVITAVEPGRSWEWEVAGISATGHRAAPVGPSQTRVTFTVVRLLFPYLVVLRSALHRLVAIAERT